MRAAPGAPIVPPRPNLDPEPMPAPGPAPGWAIGLTLALALAAAVAWRGMRRPRRRAAPGAAEVPETHDDRPSTPAGRLLLAAERSRAALVDRFGPSWAAKTTEEIAAEPDLDERLGAEWSGPLLQLLREADRVKFAGEAIGDVQGDAWEAWSAGFVAAMAAGATSRISGK